MATAGVQAARLHARVRQHIGDFDQAALQEEATFEATLQYP